MIKSMTGYGFGEGVGFGKKFIVEMKGVNHRFSDVYLRVPRSLIAMEDKIKKLIQSRVARGRIDCFLSMESDHSESAVSVKVDQGLAAAYHKAITELRDNLNIHGHGGSISLQEIHSLPGVLSLEAEKEDAAQWWPVIEEAITAALAGLIEMRSTEGNKLAGDLRKRLGRIADFSDRIEVRAPDVVSEYKNRLTVRMQELLNDGSIDPARIAAEAALYAERSDIAEEILRMDSHLSQFAACLDQEEAIGRKLDFLAQEIHREITTIGSKTNDVEIGRLVIEIKSEVEKIREQVQNIE